METIKPPMFSLTDVTVQPGTTFPLGATVRDGGVNFCLFAKEATAVELLLFEFS